MHRLRSSLLFRGSDRIVAAVLLAAAQALFLWMFLSADPIETALRSEAALAFAADWRHGMAGNSWLYMPGFFATAAAAWLYAATAPRLAPAHVGIIAVLATAIATLGFPAGARMAAGDYTMTTAVVLPAALPRFTARAAAQGVYTLATWSIFVLACRTALVRRTWRPFALPAVLTLGLMVIRPWTVGDFTSLWVRRIATADPVACASVAAIAALSALLALSVQRSQSRANPPYATGIRRAETTSTR